MDTTHFPSLHWALTECHQRQRESQDSNVEQSSCYSPCHKESTRLLAIQTHCYLSNFSKFPSPPLFLKSKAVLKTFSDSNDLRSGTASAPLNTENSSSSLWKGNKKPLSGLNAKELIKPHLPWSCIQLTCELNYRTLPRGCLQRGKLWFKLFTLVWIVQLVFWAAAPMSQMAFANLLAGAPVGFVPLQILLTG